ncbi:MAG: hypothetical protein ACLFRY_11600 [Spirochaetia bacterium]
MKLLRLLPRSGGVSVFPVAAALLALVAFLNGCAGAPGPVNDPVEAAGTENHPLTSSFAAGGRGELTTLPVDGSPVFVGISENRFYDEDELDDALEYAARQAVRYERIFGEAGVLDTRKGGYTYVEVDYDESRVGELKDRLEIIDRHTDTRGTVIRAVLPGASLDLDIEAGKMVSRHGSFCPSWSAEIPDIPGYLVSLGIADKRFALTESVRTADEEALMGLLSQIYVEIEAILAETPTVIGRVSRRVISQTASAEITGLYVPLRWQSEDGRYFYSLAVCPESNRRR